MKLKRNLLVDMALGAAAGVAATWLMGKVTGRLYELEGEADRKREQEARGGKMAYGVAAEKAARAVGTSLVEERRKSYGSALHWALGAGMGAAYGALRPRVPWVSAGYGSLFGVAFFLLVDEGLNTALGLTPPPGEFPWETHARGLAGHTAFGVATESALRLATRAGT